MPMSQHSNISIGLSEKVKTTKNPSLDIKKLHNFSLDFWRVNMLCQKDVRNIFEKTKERKCEPRMLYPTTLTFKHKGHSKTIVVPDGEHCTLNTSSKVTRKHASDYQDDRRDINTGASAKIKRKLKGV